MAVSSGSWFQSWQPPNVFTDHLDLHGPVELRNLSTRRQDFSNVGPNFLPVLLHLGLLTPRALPPGRGADERAGPFRTVYRWQQLDFAYPSEEERAEAIAAGAFVPANNLPLGVEVYGRRLFITMPKWKSGVPATLATLPRAPREPSPRLAPYPDWGYHSGPPCAGLTSVFRVHADPCGRLWVLDSGQVDVTVDARQLCPPAIHVFDLATDELLVRHDLPDRFVKQDSLYSNIVVDVRDGECADAFAYVADVWRFGLVVFGLREGRSWRVTDHLFYPDPLAATYRLHGLEFHWTDGIFGMALSPGRGAHDDRVLYFHPMSSFREFYVHTSVVRNETGWQRAENAFRVMGQSRGRGGHASASAMDRSGVMFFNLVTQDAVGCWDSRKPYKRANIGVVAKSRDVLLFPNDLKIDNDHRQSVWVISNKLPFYLYKGLDSGEVNFRVLTARVDEAIEGTICDPRVRDYGTFAAFPDGEDCY